MEVLWRASLPISPAQRLIDSGICSMEEEGGYFGAQSLKFHYVEEDKIVESLQKYLRTERVIVILLISLSVAHPERLIVSLLLSALR